MLLNLHIENIAIIEKIDIEFSGGFNVLTGQTGAGKSIIIDSISLLTGSKSSKDLIGPFGNTALVSAVFSHFTKQQLDSFSECGVFPDDDNNIVITRKITTDGRGIAKINGVNVPSSTLKSISRMLVNIHGQHDGSKILDPSSHIEYLDEFADSSFLLEKYRKEYETVKEIRKKLDKLFEIKNKKVDLEAALKFKIDELEKADIKPGEYAELKNARSTALNSAAISKCLYDCDQLLNSDDSCILDSMSEVIGQLASVKEFYDKVTDTLDKAETIKAELDEISAEIESLLSEHQDFGYTPEYIEDRMYTLERIIARYGSEENAAQSLDQLKAELSQLENNDAETEKTQQQYLSCLTVLETLAHELSQHRIKAAEKLSDTICRQLKELDMPQVKFKVSIKRNVNERGGNKYTANGYDSIEFLLSANEGMQLRPLYKIASGGELSRIMLCIKSTLNDEKSYSSAMIYDEIDTGVSGSTASKIGKKLKSFAENRQVFCITHLAQIAALADHHYKVEKITENSMTRSIVYELDQSQRREEIARIMGGVNITEQMLKSADELITGAE